MWIRTTACLSQLTSIWIYFENEWSSKLCNHVHYSVRLLGLSSSVTSHSTAVLVTWRNRFLPNHQSVNIDNHVVLPQGLEPWTHWLRVSYSTNWATRAWWYLLTFMTSTRRVGLEPTHPDFTSRALPTALTGTTSLQEEYQPRFILNDIIVSAKCSRPFETFWKFFME